MSITIFVEDKSDQNFIEDIFKEIKITKKLEYYTLKSNINSTRRDIKDELIQRKEKIDKCFFIVDADNSKNKDCKSSYKKTIDKILMNIFNNKKLSDSFLKNNLFFFPNNKDDGNLEDLVNKILIVEDFDTCFTNYEECLKNVKGILSDRIPDLKGKLSIYDYLTGGSKDRKEPKKYFNNSNYNLKHEKLEKLKDFLIKITIS